jgi:putative ABC transport system permease protein
MSGERAARRAVLRWALRLVRRDWRQQLLVLLLLTIAVGAAVAGSAMALASNQDPAGQFGSSGGRIQLDGTDAARAQAAIAAARTRFGEIDVVAHTNVAVPGSVLRLDVRDQDPNGIYSHPMVARRQGRYPTAPGGGPRRAPPTSSAPPSVDHRPR